MVLYMYMVLYWVLIVLLLGLAGCGAVALWWRGRRPVVQQLTRKEVLALYLTQDVLLPCVRGRSQVAVIEELLGHLVAQHRELDFEVLRAALLEREASGSTFLGEGVACPHVHTPLVKRLMTVVGVSPEPVVFGEGNQAQIFVLTLSPRQMNSPYMSFITAVLTQLRSVRRREAILMAQDGAAMQRIFLDS